MRRTVAILFLLVMLSPPVSPCLAAGRPVEAPAHLSAVLPDRPTSDWLANAGPGSMPVRPADGSRALQSPPGFTWPAAAGVAGYDVRLTGPGDFTADRRTTGNHLLLDRVLAPGRYAWQVRPAGAGDEGWSRPRSFEIAADAWPFPVPDMPTLWDRATAAPHPRILPADPEWQAHRADLLSGRRAGLFARARAMAHQAIGRIFRPAPPDTDTDTATDTDTDTDTDSPGAGSSMEPGWWPTPDEGRYRQELEALERAAMVWFATGEEEILADALARLDALLDLPADGPTAFTRNDQLSLDHAWALAVAYDLLYAVLDPARRARIRAAIAPTAEAATRWFLRNPEDARINLSAAPYNSHGYLHLANLAAISVILAGEAPQARAWFDAAIPLFLTLPHPWGSDDGASGNGGNYAFYYLLDLMPRWDVLRNGIGIDPADTAWARNFPVFATYMAAPGAPFVFGDGAGHRDGFLTGTVLRGLDARTGGRMARWYSLKVPVGAPAPPLMEFTAPPAAPAAAGPGPKDLPDAAHFASAGLTAIHADLLSGDGAAIFFRSGPFGTGGHNHADQNSFTVQIGGERMAIDSGYYDSYGSDHMNGWTRQSRAHNLVTFDGGQGQVTKDDGADGRTIAFADTGRLAHVTGDATAAYGGELKQAIRTLAFLRPDMLLVYDLVESAEPRHFEWNLHSLNEMAVYARNAFRIPAKDTSLCVEMLSPGDLEFEKSDQFGVPPQPPERADLPAQWHARFSQTRATRKVEFLALLRMNCAAARLRDLTPLPDGGFDLVVGNNRVRIDAKGAALNPSGGDR